MDVRPVVQGARDVANANSTACSRPEAGTWNVFTSLIVVGDSHDPTITATAQQTRWGKRIRVGGAAKVTQTLRLERGELSEYTLYNH